jgi:hypothetical protein
MQGYYTPGRRGTIKGAGIARASVIGEPYYRPRRPVTGRQNLGCNYGRQFRYHAAQDMPAHGQGQAQRQRLKERQSGDSRPNRDGRAAAQR